MNESNIKKFITHLEKTDMPNFDIKLSAKCALSELKNVFPEIDPNKNEFGVAMNLFEINVSAVGLMFGSQFHNVNRAILHYDEYDGTPADKLKVINNLKKYLVRHTTNPM